MKKIITLITSSLLLVQVGTAGAVSTSSISTSGELARLLTKYESRISSLESQVTTLKEQIAQLQKNSGTITTGTGTKTSTTGTSVVILTGATNSSTGKTITASGTIIVATGSTSTGNAKYDTIINKINSDLTSILTSNSISLSGSIGLFEFIEPDVVFISIDDGNNPSGVTAFKNKILYTYSTTGSVTYSMVGLFDLDYTTQKYVTKSGKNPYAGVTRTRIKNPAYTGKLLEETTTSTTTTTSSWSTSTSTTTTTTTGVAGITNPTATDIHYYYDRNKLAETITLADIYLAKNPNDLDVLGMRYLSLYIKGRFADAIKDLDTIMKVQNGKMDCVMAKNAVHIAKAAANATATTKYTNYVSASCK